MTLLPSQGSWGWAGTGQHRAENIAALLSDCPDPTVTITALPPTPVTTRSLLSSSEMGTTIHPSHRAADEFTHTHSTGTTPGTEDTNISRHA